MLDSTKVRPCTITYILSNILYEIEKRTRSNICIEVYHTRGLCELDNRDGQYSACTVHIRSKYRASCSQLRAPSTSSGEFKPPPLQPRLLFGPHDRNLASAAPAAPDDVANRFHPVWLLFLGDDSFCLCLPRPVWYFVPRIADPSPLLCAASHEGLKFCFRDKPDESMAPKRLSDSSPTSKRAKSRANGDQAKPYNDIDSIPSKSTPRKKSSLPLSTPSLASTQTILSYFQRPLGVTTSFSSSTTFASKNTSFSSERDTSPCDSQSDYFTTQESPCESENELTHVDLPRKTLQQRLNDVWRKYN